MKTDNFKTENGKSKGTTQNMEETLRRGVSEMLFLHLLQKEDSYINDIMNQVEQLSDGACNVAYPYAMIFRLEEYQYIQGIGKRISNDGRRRQFYGITDDGKNYLGELVTTYHKFASGINNILNS